MRLLRRPGVAGTLVLLAFVALVLLRPARESGRSGDDESRPGSQAALITRVVDGDTVEVRIGEVSEGVRYIGIDTPESVKPDSPVECFGREAAVANRRLTEGRRARLVFDRELRDSYGRLLAYVYVEGRLISAVLVRRGLARTLTIPPNDQFAPLLARLERRAAVAGRGLWSACPT